MKTITINSRLKLVIDHDNAATPAMVEANGGKYTSTYSCAIDQECVDDQVMLTGAEIDGLLNYEDEVNDAYEIARKDNPEYN